MTHDWQLGALDLAAYLARVGQPAAEPSLAALSDLQTAHVRSFCFDNIDVLLRQHPGVGLPAVQGKLVARGRGGYCFEHATLFAAVLETLGYDISRHLGRVGDSTSPRTHLVVLVNVDGQRVLCDPGIGRPPLQPIPLADGAEVTAGGWTHRLRTTSEGDAGVGWSLDRWVNDEWEHMHTTDLLPVRPVDVALGHHWTSTQPASHFATTLMVTRHGLDAEGPLHTSVSLDGIVVRRPGRPTEHEPLDPGALGGVLEGLGAGLTVDETARLVQRVRDLSDG